MRIVKYNVELVKESSCNYTALTRSTIDKKVANPWDVFRVLTDIYKLSSQAEEIFYLICLDTKLNIIGVHEVSRGTLNLSLVHPREVFKRALLNNANKIMIAHNHPSGSLNPSDEDKRITNRLVKCGEIMGIDLVDHIIIGDEQYYSFKENMLL